MRGSNHVATSCALSAATAAVALRATALAPVATTLAASVPHGVLGIAEAFALTALGALMPDVDSPTSTLGRYVHLPVRHRTWTHTIWAVMLLFVSAKYVPALVWAALGYLFHLCMDSLSSAGVCWFYPLERYRTFANGAFYKPGHKLKLYGYDDGREPVVAGVVIIGCLAVIWL